MAELYRKKPVVIEALLLTGNESELVEFLDRAPATNGQGGYSREGDEVYAVEIETLEGTMRADLGDWIIRGVQGELYPCKPDIFAATYEPAEEA